MPDHEPSRLILPGPKRAVTLGIVSCAAQGCHSKGLGLPRHGDDGELIPSAPEGWGEILAIRDDGAELGLFVCSPACERRLAMRLTTPGLGSLDG